LLLQKINQVVLWDKIIRRGENAALDYKDLKAKYYFYDDGHGLRYPLLNIIISFIICFITV